MQEKEIKVAKDEAENEKDNVTEKEAVPVESGAGGDVAKVEEISEVNKSTVAENGTAAVESETENNATVTTLDESKLSEVTEATEEIVDGATSTPIEKKPKKEKTKKRWSFRSFSFSKKDKQKPEKKKSAEEAANDTAAAVTNGECEKVLEEVSLPILRKND